MDAVNTPGHYKRDADPLVLAVRVAVTEGLENDFLNLEAIEALASMLSIEEMRGYLRGNSFKYRWRYTHKNGVEDLKKARWYEERLLRMEEVIANFLDNQK